MTEKEISKKQTIWLRQYDESHNIQYIVSSNTDNTETSTKYYLYQTSDNGKTWEKINTKDVPIFDELKAESNEKPKTVKRTRKKKTT